MRKSLAFFRGLMLVLWFLGGLWLFIHATRMFNIRQHASKVQEPLYTLVVNTTIIHHDFEISFDRFTYDSKTGQFIGKEDECAEIPLFTVLTAMGAEVCWSNDDMVTILYSGEKFLFFPGKQLLCAVDRNCVDTIALAKEMNDEENLLLIHPETVEELRRENDEYIVDLGCLHKLALYMGFSFTTDHQRGIIYFSS